MAWENLSDLSPVLRGRPVDDGEDGFGGAAPGCSMAVTAGEEADPWEVADMRRHLETACLDRYREGARRWGDDTCHLAPALNVNAAMEELADGLFYLRQVQRLLAPQAGRLRIYIAGPYRAATVEERDRNIARARLAAAELLRRGHSPFCPHTMTAQFDDHFPDLPDEAYLCCDLDWLLLAHALLVLPGWEDSRGTVAEIERARALQVPVYFSLSDVPSPNEVLLGWPPKRDLLCARQTGALALLSLRNLLPPIIAIPKHFRASWGRTAPARGIAESVAERGRAEGNCL